MGGGRLLRGRLSGRAAFRLGPACLYRSGAALPPAGPGGSGLRPDSAALCPCGPRDWPQAPAWLSVAGLRPDLPASPLPVPVASGAGRAGVWLRRDWGCRSSPVPGHRLASNAGQAGIGWWLGSASTCPPRPCGSLTASIAGRAVGCRVPSRPCRPKTGLNRRPGCQVRGFSGAWVGWGRAGVPPHKLQGAGSVASRRPCVQFAAGAPRHDPTPRSRTRPTAGGETEAVTDNGPLHSDHRECFRSPQRSTGDGLVFSPPTGGTTPTKRKGGDVPGCPRSKLHARPPCSN